MADIKLCDKCGQVFNPRGAWQSLTAITFTVSDDEGVRQLRHDTTLELCGRCAIVPNTSPATPLALATGRQLVDPGDNVWQEADGSFSVERDGLPTVGPFSSARSASNWVHSTRPAPEDEDYDG